MERKQILVEFLVVGTLSVAIVIWAFNNYYLERILDDLNSKDLPHIFILVFSGMGAYLLVFKLTILLYFKVIWKLVHRRTLLHGHWAYIYNHKYNPKKEIWDRSADQMGTARIDHTPEDIRIYGTSEEANDGAKSSLISIWNMPATSLQGNQLNTALEIMSGDGYEKGFAVLQIITEPPKYGFFPVEPKEIKGYYCVLSSKNESIQYGRIVFQRS